MGITDGLRSEHESVLLVVEEMRRQADSIRSGGKVDRAKIEKIADFLRNFVDRCHHAKEEKLLFPRLLERGRPSEGGPVGMMLEEHETGRGLLRAVLGALPDAAQDKPAALTEVAESLKEYAELLDAHIEKENTVLFPLAEAVLTSDDQQSLSAAFKESDTKETGQSAIDAYCAFARSLASSH